VAALVATCARLRPDEAALADPVQATKAALRAVACRIHQLDEEIGLADERLAKLAGRAAPRLLKRHAIGVDHARQLLATAGDNPERLRGEAALAHLCGTAPVPASSGKTHRHRLHRVVTATPTERCVWGSWSACAGARAPAPMPSGAPSKGCPSRRSCAVRRYLAREVYHALVADFEALNAT
jgi:transposase